MTIAQISRCVRCGKLDFCDADGYCFDDAPTQIILYSTGFMQAATPPAPVDGDKTGAA